MDSQNRTARRIIARVITLTRRPGRGASIRAHPLGPMILPAKVRFQGRARLIGLLVLGGSGVLLSLAVWMKPDPAGLGTHRQLGYPSCTMVTVTGYPCPTCGMTTAFAYTVRGQLLSAFSAQPAGFALALLTFVAAALSAVTAITGRVWTVNWYRMSPVRVILGVVAAVLVGWVYKLLTGVMAGTLPVEWSLG